MNNYSTNLTSLSLQSNTNDSIRQTQSQTTAGKHKINKSHPKTCDNISKMLNLKFDFSSSMLMLLIFICLISSTNSQSLGLASRSYLLHQPSYKITTDLTNPSVRVGQVQQITNITNSIGKILAAVDDIAVYGGSFESLQNQPILQWITQKEGQMRINIQKKFEFNDDPIIFNQSEQKQNSRNKYLRIIEFQENKPHKSKIPITAEQVQQFNQIYEFWIILLNPKYMTEQLLTMQFAFNPKKLKQPQPEPEPHPNNTQTPISNRRTSQKQKVIELGEQSCVVEGENQWSCNYTRMNYTKIWRRSNLDDDFHGLNISYRMKIEAKEDKDAGFNYEEYQFVFQILSINTGISQESDHPIVNSAQLIHFRTKEPLILRDRRLQVSMFCIFVAALVGIQIYSALKINSRLLLNPAFSCKLSLFTISFCTISDLSSTIDFAYRVFQTLSNFNRIFYIIPTLAYTVLYFGFDIQLITRVLITQFNNRAFNVGENASFKKILIIFYVAFFFSYEGLVILKAFFEYQWWLILITSSCLFLPQIVRNVRTGNGGDNRFDYWFVLGFLAPRTLFVIYEHACPENYERIKPFLWLAILLSVLFISQILILYFQSKLGARFFIPKFLRPPQFEYSHKINRGDFENSGNEQCAICIHSLFEIIEQEQKKNENLNQSQKLDLEKKMLDEITVYRTPCGHLYHEECLKSWVQVKLECPSCRQKLPPL